MIKAVFFDYNGCLLDDRGLTFRSVLEVCRAFKSLRKPTLEEWRGQIGSNYMDFYRSTGISPKVSAKELNAVRNNFILSNWCDAELRSDAESVINKCKVADLKTAVVSAETEVLLRRRLREAGLEKKFDEIYSDASPKKSYLEKALKDMQLLPEEVLFVEDTAEGIRAGREVGLITVGFTNATSYGFHNDIRTAKPRWTIDELSEIFIVLYYVNLVGSVYPDYLERR